MLSLLVACSASSPVVGEVLTDGGTWLLSLGTTEYDQGAATLVVDASMAEDGEPAPGLLLSMRSEMESMDHTGEATAFCDLGDGEYDGDATFDMAGVWILAGEAGDDEGTEGFTFVVEVLP